ncbi:MAG: hypothetical protein RL210_10, partial [Pseudomonadota bacterium]
QMQRELLRLFRVDWMFFFEWIGVGNFYLYDSVKCFFVVKTIM